MKIKKMNNATTKEIAEYFNYNFDELSTMDIEELVKTLILSGIVKEKRDFNFLIINCIANILTEDVGEVIFPIHHYTDDEEIVDKEFESITDTLNNNERELCRSKSLEDKAKEASNYIRNNILG